MLHEVTAPGRTAIARGTGNVSATYDKLRRYPRVGSENTRASLMSDAFIRYLLLLREIPAAPNHVDTVTLARRLEEQGICVTRRTIQRDLERLSSRLPLECNDAGKPYAWAWHESAGDSCHELVVRVAKDVER